MTQPAESNAVHEVVCPHCGKTFEAAPLTGAAERYRGFKCPHCRLFVAYDRARPDESGPTASTLP